MTPRLFVWLVLLFIVSTVVAYQVAAWQMSPHRVSIQRGPDVGPPTDKPGPSIPVDPPANNHDLPCDPSKGTCST